MWHIRRLISTGTDVVIFDGLRGIKRRIAAKQQTLGGDPVNQSSQRLPFRARITDQTIQCNVGATSNELKEGLLIPIKGEDGHAWLPEGFASRG